jgi:hypothetical protein
VTLGFIAIVLGILFVAVGSRVTAPGDPRKISHAHTTGHHLRFGWNAFRAHRTGFIAGTLLLFVSWVILEFLVVALTHSRIRGTPFINLALHLIFLVAFGALLARLYGMALDVVDGRRTEAANAGAAVRQGIAVLVCALSYALIVASGLVLLVIPGVYVAVRYAPWLHFAVTSHIRDTMESLRRAGALTKGQWLLVGSHVLACLLANIGGAALLGIGLLISFPVALLATASLFRTLEHPTSGVA